MHLGIHVCPSAAVINGILPRLRFALINKVEIKLVKNFPNYRRINRRWQSQPLDWKYTDFRIAN